jgi:hypothetical protein
LVLFIGGLVVVVVGVIRIMEATVDLVVEEEADLHT